MTLVKNPNTILPEAQGTLIGGKGTTISLCLSLKVKSSVGGSQTRDLTCQIIVLYTALSLQCHAVYPKVDSENSLCSSGKSMMRSSLSRRNLRISWTPKRNNPYYFIKQDYCNVPSNIQVPLNNTEQKIKLIGKDSNHILDIMAVIKF